MTSALAEPPANRAEGHLKASFERHGGRARAVACFEAGGYRLRFPKVPPDQSPACEAVCINTGGGMVGGDVARFAFACGPGAAATVTTQSAEKVYRSSGAVTEVQVTLDVAAGARLDWLPQETILFDAVRLTRSLDAALTADATLLAVETLVFGRLAMGETVSAGNLHDRWRVRRDGRLIFAEDLRIEGPVSTLLDRSTLGGRARACAMLLLVAPAAEAKLEGLRAALAPFGDEWGASAWNGFLVMRAASPSPERVRRTIVAALQSLREQPVPRVWQ